MNIKDAAVPEAVKRIAKITGESQAQAVATAVTERLALFGSMSGCRVILAVAS